MTGMRTSGAPRSGQSSCTGDRLAVVRRLAHHLDILVVLVPKDEAQGGEPLAAGHPLVS
jgi:hypothetical protein